MARGASQVLQLLLISISFVNADDAIGGTFRYGHIHWTSKGNVVDFVVEVAFQRAVQSANFLGTGPDGYAQVGDVLTLFGREPPKFDFGDLSIVRVLQMQVTAFSIQEDWVMGQILLSHRYSSPNNGGMPWAAQLSGCCRLSSLINNANGAYLLTAEVDLNAADMSPRAVSLPMVTVPKTFVGVSKASFYVPGYDPSKREAVDFSIDAPTKVGEAANFTSGATLAMPLAPLSNASSGGALQTACVANSIGPGCIFELLKMVPPPIKGSPGLTIEGWVRITRDEGGVVLSVGSTTGLPGYPAAAAGDCSTANALYRTTCYLALVYIKVNATHVTVGHERPAPADGPLVLETVSFAAASNGALITDLLDQSIYPTGSPSQPTLTGKWVHVAVVRKIRWMPPLLLGATPDATNSFYGASYKVYVNNYQLGVPTYPGVAGCDVTSSCAGCDNPFPSAAARFARTRCPKLLPRGDASAQAPEGFEYGESEALPAMGPDAAAAWAAAGSRAALIFGAYGGGAAAALPAPDATFDGLLDEWRLWNGARARADLLGTMRTALTPALIPTYGDPTVVSSGVRTGTITQAEYRVDAVLMLDYSFDADLSALEKGGAPPAPRACAATDFDACYVTRVSPGFPGCEQGDSTCPLQYKLADDRLAGTAKRIFQLSAPSLQCVPTAAALAAAAAAGLPPPPAATCPTKARTDSSGVVFYSLAGGASVGPGGLVTMDAANAGAYQLTVRMALPGSVASVPVDMIILAIPDPSVQPSLSLYAPIATGAAAGGAAAGDGVAYLGFGGGGDGAGAAEAALRQLTAAAGLYPAAVTVYTGSPVVVEAHGQAAVGAAPNLTVGFTVGTLPAAARLSTVDGVSPGTRMALRWTPCAADAGDVTACFEAVTYLDGARARGPSVGRPAGSDSIASEMRCAHLRVVADGPPMFEGVPPAANLTMGRRGGFAVRARDANCLDNVTLRAVPPPPPPPPGGAPPPPPRTYAGTPRMPGALPVGAVLGPQAAYVSAAAAPGCDNGQMRLFEWNPPYNFGGFSQLVCFEASDLPPGGRADDSCRGPAPHAAVVCVHLHVERCRYALQQDDQLQTIAPKYGLDWMRLWSFNSNLGHPDYFVYNGQVLWVGHPYRVNPKETAEGVATRMGMPLSQLTDYNNDLLLDPTLKPGQMLCVVPNSCTGAAQSLYTGMVPDYNVLQLVGAVPADPAPAPAGAGAPRA